MADFPSRSAVVLCVDKVDDDVMSMPGAWYIYIQYICISVVLCTFSFILTYGNIHGDCLQTMGLGTT